MNKMARSVLALYSYDDNPDELTLPNIMRQSIALIASMPSVVVHAYQVKKRVYDKQSMYLHLPVPGQSTAEHIPVSYTHLEVYKRQIRDCANFRIYLQKHGSPQNQPLFQKGAGCGRRSHGLHAVSYTHLDVYKRQGGYHAEARPKR